MRSHHGCTICRQRKLKCDEVKPVCGQCAKSERECVFSQSAVFRNFELQSLLGRGPGKAATGDDTLNGLFESHQVWLEVPADLTFVSVVNPFEGEETIVCGDDPMPEHRRQEEAQNTSVAEWDSTLLASSTQDSGPASLHHPANTLGLTPETQLIPDNLSETLDFAFADRLFSHVHSPEADHQTRVILDEDSGHHPEEEQEDDAEANIVALQLLRHFRQGPGQWLDLFDTSAYFSRKIPIRATTRPLLKSAICALAAKHLSRTRHVPRESYAERGTPSQSPAPDWQYHAVRYYHQAIRLLKHAIANGLTEPDDQDAGSKHMDTFAAVAILCMYELMNSPGSAWKAHLAALPLYTSASGSGSSPVPMPNSPVKGPIFWSLARQDFLCAFISETQTRLNLDHIRLWQNFDLAAPDNSLLLPFSPFTAADADEDAKSNELLWLLGKIVNYTTSGDAICPEDFSRPAGQRMSLGVTQEFLLRRWAALDAELRRWRDGLPATFSPSARTAVPAGGGEAEAVWYEIPACAATMQSYHMACILLLVNRPQESTAIRSTVSARLRSYRHIQKEALRHGREICGISLADPTNSVRVHSVQPLFVAGQSFHEEPDQRLVVELLTGIEEELGWATNYQVCKLEHEWQVNNE